MTTPTPRGSLLGLFGLNEGDIAVINELVDAIERDARDALVDAVGSQHRYVETVNSDGDDWYGCVCGERDNDCSVLSFLGLATPSSTPDVEELLQRELAMQRAKPTLMRSSGYESGIEFALAALRDSRS